MSIARLYFSIFLYSIIVMTLFVSLGLVSKTYNGIRKGYGGAAVAFVICICYAVWIGHRPPTYEFADTGNYAHVFKLMQLGLPGVYEESSEWVWNGIAGICAKIMDVSSYLTIIAIGYFGFTYLACRVLTPNNVLVSVLFMMGAFSFYSYGVNGLRNGLACSITLAAVAFLASSRKTLIIGLLLAFFAVNIHKTIMLPIASLFASIYVVKNFKWAYTFWILSIIISLVAGGAVTALFAGLGFDDRVSYLTTIDEGMFSHTGFRWDFLIYSMMPIILGYYVIIKKGIQDKTYTILLNTYTLANAFWVIVIRANYSNRFAYLSWFMYPIVLAYPLLKLDIWGERQGKRTAQIMLVHVGFTWFMSTFM